MSRATILAREAALPLVRPVGTVLDIGPGIRPQQIVESGYQICVEPHHEYADWLRANGHCVMEMTALEALECVTTIDTVVAIDVIEHMDRAEGEAFIRRALEIARQQVVIFTPFGFMPQPAREDGRDAWGMNGGRWQEHRSGWKPEDFPGWNIALLPNFHYGRRTAFFAVHG